MGSVMVTGTRTRSTSTLSGRTRALRPLVVETRIWFGGLLRFLHFARLNVDIVDVGGLRESCEAEARGSAEGEKKRRQQTR